MPSNGDHDSVVAICADGPMFLPALATAADAIRHAPSAEVFLFTVEGIATPDFARWGERLGNRFHHVELDFAAWLPANLASGWRAPPASLFRLFLARYFGGKFRRIVYLDADIRIVGSIEPLLGVELGPHALAAADDLVFTPLDENSAYLERAIPQHRIDLGYDLSLPYFNCGMMVIDPVGWEAEALTDRALAFMRERPELCVFSEQDALNVVQQGHYAALSPKWNASPAFLAEYGATGLIDPVVRHYFGPAKPWMPEWRGPAEDSERYRAFLADLWPAAGENGLAMHKARWRPLTRKMLGSVRRRMPRLAEHYVRAGLGGFVPGLAQRDRHPAESRRLISAYLARRRFADSG